MNSKAVALLLVAAIVSCATCQDIQVNHYKLQLVAKTDSGICSSTEELENRKRIGQDIDLLINNTILPAFRQQSGPEHTPSHGSCDCGGPGWRRVAYLNLCLIQHRLAHKLGSSLLLQEDRVLDTLMLALIHVIQHCTFLKMVNTLRSVEESLDIRRDNRAHSYSKTSTSHKPSMVHTLME